ncbi:YetF domain-containing protein [Methylobacterium sp. CM6257]
MMRLATRLAAGPATQRKPLKFSPDPRPGGIGPASRRPSHWVLERVAARSARLSRLVEGGAIRIALDGKLQPAELQRHAVSEADLNEALRQSGLEDATGARRVVLEPSGRINVLKAG